MRRTIRISVDLNQKYNQFIYAHNKFLRTMIRIFHAIRNSNAYVTLGDSHQNQNNNTLLIQMY